MKKQFSGFLCGVLSMALVGTLGVTALAAGGQAEYGLFGVMLLGSEVVAKGETMVGENGAEVPVVVTYRDEKGGATNYISVRKLAELLDVSIGWNAEKGNVELPQFQPTVISPGVSPADKDKDVPSQPELGITAGPISEIDPVQLQDKTPADTYTTRYQTKFGTAGVQFNPGSTTLGGDALLSVTNHGATDIILHVTRPHLIGFGGDSFTSVRLKPGETIDRAFRAEPHGSVMSYTLEYGVRTVYTTSDVHDVVDVPVDVTVTLELYR